MPSTAASIAAVIEMVDKGNLPSQGFIKQEEIPYEKLIQTSNGQLYLKGDSTRMSPEAPVPIVQEGLSRYRRFSDIDAQR